MPTFRRLTIITHEFLPFAGGMATYAGGVADVAAGWDVDLTVIAPRYDTPPPALPYRLILALRHHDLSPARLARLLLLLLRTPRDTFMFGVDIRSALVLCAVGALTGRPYGMMIHGSEVLKLRRNGPLARYARAAYRRAIFITANSKATADIFSAHVRTHQPPRVAHLGVEGRWFDDAPASFESEALAQFLSRQPSICTVGRLEDRKGHGHVLQALAQLRARDGRQTGYVIAGPTIDEGYRRQLLAAAEASGVPVFFAGILSEPDLKRLYARSVCHVLAAVCLPSKIEGFGLVLLEAAAQGCPSIATRVGGIPEVIVDGQTGLLTDDGDIPGLAAALDTLLSDDALRQRMGAAARQHARDFTWKACARKTFQTVLKLPPA